MLSLSWRRKLESRGIGVKLFYSWQSDIDKHINFKFIEEAISNAITKVEKENPNITIEADRDTKGEAGAVNIKEVILDKIKESDIAVFDISVVNAECSCKKIRKNINPNVAFELGFAVATVGWNNIILIFNENYGELKDIPFDLQGHRVLTYKFDGDNVKRKSCLNNLSKSLEDAIDKIINNPHTVSENEDNRKEIERSKDKIVIEEFFNKLNINDFDVFYRNFNENRRAKIPELYYELSERVNSVAYSLYDKKFEGTSKEFISMLDELFNSDNRIVSKYSNEIYTYLYIDEVKEYLSKCRKKLNEIIEYVKQSYIDINIT